MLELLQDLVRHKAFANASLLQSIRRNESAAHDAELRKILHHVILANRFWLALILGLPFNLEEESRIPESLDTVAVLHRETHERELEWISRAEESALTRTLETPFFPEQTFSVGQALTQVCLHSHGHRAQCALRLRALGGTPPALDFIVWLKDRPAADWS